MSNLYTVQEREKSNSRGSYCLSLLDSNHCYYHPICGYWVLNSQAFKLQSPRPGRVAISSSGVKVCGSEIRKKFPAWSVLELWDQNLCEVQSNLALRNCSIRNKLAVVNHFPWPIFQLNSEQIDISEQFCDAQKVP